MDLKARVKRYARLRFAIFYPFALYFLFFSVPDDMSLLMSFVFLVGGVALRLWSNGYVIKMGKLTTSGPYALVRNPLYLGTILIILGFFVFLREYGLAGVFAVVMTLAYRRTIMQEQKMLEDKFGEDYRDYKKNVPCLWPRLTPYPRGEKWPFSWARILENREHKIVLWVAIVVIAFWLKRELLIEKRSFDVQMLWLAGTAVFLALSDLVLDMIRKGMVKNASAAK